MMSQPGPPRTIQPRATFYRLARLAIRAGKLTPQERDTIARVGTRKAGYWDRHLVDLVAILKERNFDVGNEQTR